MREILMDIVNAAMSNIIATLFLSIIGLGSFGYFFVNSQKSNQKGRNNINQTGNNNKADINSDKTKEKK